MPECNLDCDPFALHILERTPTTLRILIVSRSYPRPQVAFKDYNFVTRELASEGEQIALEHEPLSSVLFKGSLLVLMQDHILQLRLRNMEQIKHSISFTPYSLHPGFVCSQLGDIYTFDDRLQMERLGRSAPAFSVLRVGQHLLVASRLRFEAFEIVDTEGEESLVLEHEQALDAQLAVQKEDSLLIGQGSKLFQTSGNIDLQECFSSTAQITCASGNCIGNVQGGVYYNQQEIAKLHGCCTACAEADGCFVAATDLFELAVWEE